MRRKIYEIIEKSDGNNKLSSIYDFAMIIIIVMSLVPLVFKEDVTVFAVIDKITVAVFIGDYTLRWLTADYKYNINGIVPFLKYPFSVMALIDLLSILPSLSIVNSSFKVLRVLRMIRAMRVFRVFKAIRYSKSFVIIKNVMKASKNSLIAVGTLALGYILVSALVIHSLMLCIGQRYR